jgi:hypothetical protein
MKKKSTLTTNHVAYDKYMISGVSVYVYRSNENIFIYSVTRTSDANTPYMKNDSLSHHIDVKYTSTPHAHHTHQSKRDVPHTHKYIMLIQMNVVKLK